MFRLLCVLWCVLSFASSARAIVIVQEGDVYDELEVIDPEFLMTGGSVNHLVLGGITNAVIEGGVIGAEFDGAAIFMMGSDHITMRGGQSGDPMGLVVSSVKKGTQYLRLKEPISACAIQNKRKGILGALKAG